MSKESIADILDVTHNHEFPLSRYKHCHNVGKKMQDYAQRVLHWDEQHCNEMFVLGCIHDIGYELNGDAFDHDDVLADVLGDSFKYAKEIRYHSKLQTEYDSMAMRLLYFGDATVDGQGNWCTFEDRLRDLACRHGMLSDVYKESLDIIEHLEALGFDDKYQM